jgi:hypothetical protein
MCVLMFYEVWVVDICFLALLSGPHEKSFCKENMKKCNGEIEREKTSFFRGGGASPASNTSAAEMGYNIRHYSAHQHNISRVSVQ